MCKAENIKWIHLSDLHFGAEEVLPEIIDIRETLLNLLSTFKKNEFKYLFISGDIFYARNFYKEKKEKKNIIIDNAIVFILRVIDSLGIRRDNVFIVPGNHDTDRKIINTDDKEEQSEKANYIDVKRKDYQNKGVLPIAKLKEFQEDFNQFCEKINTVKYDATTGKTVEDVNLNTLNYCDAGHKLVTKEDIDVLMLNSSLSSCKDAEKGNLLLGKQLFKEEIKKIEESHWEDESFPLFVLSHHDPSYFEDSKSLTIQLKRKKDMVLYLCGHDHYADTTKSENINILRSGTHEEKEIGMNYKLNEPGFLTGSFNTTLCETSVCFYKWNHRY